jgi:hypothetical protein
MDRVYLKEGGERIENGRWWKEKKEGQGALGKTAIAFLLNRTEEGVDRTAGRWRGSAHRRSSARRRPGGGAKRRGGRGDLSLVLTLC